MSMKTVVLHGALRQQFGHRLRLDISSPAQALRLLDVNFPKRFAKVLGHNAFFMTTAPSIKSPGCRQIITEERLWRSVGQDEIHIRPIAEGRIKALFAGLGVFGGGGAAAGGLFGGGLFGAAGGAGGAGLFGLGAGGALGGFGPILLGVALLGISMLLNKQPKEEEKKQEKKSFLFDGPVNTFEQGGPVPLVYGTVRMGSVVISGGLEVTQTKGLTG